MNDNEKKEQDQQSGGLNNFASNLVLTALESFIPLEFGTLGDDEIEVPNQAEPVSVLSGDGNDLIDASDSSEAKNRLDGGTGEDELLAGVNDRLLGGSQDDILDASISNGGGNRLYGGTEDDLIIAGSDDRVFGGDGEDILLAGLGNNTLTGGSQGDQFVIVPASLPDNPNTITDFGQGADLLILAGVLPEDVALADSEAGATVSVSGQEVAILTGIAAADLAAPVLGDDGTVSIALNPDAEPNFDPLEPLVFGTLADDEIEIPNQTEPVSVFSGDGNDLIDANDSSEAKNRLYGGTGEDELLAGINDRLIGGTENDLLDASINNGGGNRLYGGTGDDQLVAGSGDRLFGGDGEDTLIVSSGNSTLTGGSEDDQFVIVAASLPDNPNTITDFGRGSDSLILAGVLPEDITIADSQAGATVSVSGQEVAILAGITAADLAAPVLVDEETVSIELNPDAEPEFETLGRIVFGTLEDDEIEVPNQDRAVNVFGGDGNDLIDANDSSDARNRLHGDRGEDELIAGINDRLFGGSEDDILDASISNGGGNRLYGGTGNDVLLAGQSDRLLGQSGDDSFFAGLGESTLTGGEGNDTFWIAHGGLPDTHNTIADFEIGSDLLGIRGLDVSFNDLVIFDTDDGSIINALGQDLALLQGVAAAELDETSFIGLEISTLAIAQEFVELYDAAFINPFAEFNNLAALLAEDAVFAFPQEQQIFGSADVIGFDAEFVGDEEILGFFTNGLTRFFPNESEVIEFLPTGSYALSDDPEENKVAIRLRQSGVGSQTGLDFEQSATWTIDINEEGLVERVEFYSNAYPLHAAALEATPPPPPPADDPLTFQTVQVDLSADATAATEVATAMWEALATNDLVMASELHAADAVWSFSIGGPSFMPYVGTAEGFTSDGLPLAPDFSNIGAILTDLLGPLGTVVAPGDLEIVETFAQGNRVLVHLKEGQVTLEDQGTPSARETGNPYRTPLDLLSWLTIEDGQVVSNEVIVNTFATVSAARPGETSPLGYSLSFTKHSPPFFVTASRVNEGILAFDEEGNFGGILFETNGVDAPELLQPIALTYGPDGNLYVTSTIFDDPATADDPLLITNGILEFDGVSGEYPDIFETRAAARNGLLEDGLLRTQNADETLDTFNPALVGNAHGEVFDAATGQLIDEGSLLLVPFDATGMPDTLAARPFDSETNTLVEPNSGDFVFADSETGNLVPAIVDDGNFIPVAVLDPVGNPIAVLDQETGDFIDPATGSTVFEFNPETGEFTDPETGEVALVFDPVTDPRVVFNQNTGAPEGLAIPGLLIPSGIKFGPDGNLYVGSAFTSRILQYDGDTGEFLSVVGTRLNGVPVANLLDPAAGLPPDFTVFVFGPDGGIYVGSLRTDIDPETGRPELNEDGVEDLTVFNPTNGSGAVLRFPGPTWEIDSATGFYIDPITGNLVEPGQPAAIATDGTDLTEFGVYGETGGVLDQQIQPLNEPSAVAFGPDLNLYAASALTTEILVYAGPLADNPGEFLGVFADVGTAVREENGRGEEEPLVLSGMGFGPDGNLYVGSSFEDPATGAPVAGSQISVFVGPNPEAFGQTESPGTFLGAFGDVTTDVSRLLLPTTPEFVFFENSFKEENAPTQRFPEISFVVGINTDRPFNEETGEIGFFQSDETDALAAYDSDFNFLGWLGPDLTDGQLAQNLTGRLFAAELTGDQEVLTDANGEFIPFDTNSEATGMTEELSLNETLDALSYTVTISGLDFGPFLGEDPQTPDNTDDDVIGFHFHNAPRGENGGIVFDIITDDDLAFIFNEDGSTTISGIWEDTEGLSAFVDDFLNTPFGQDVPLYFNVHTNGFPTGEIRGQITADNPLDGIGGVILGPRGHILVSSQLSNEVLEYNSLTGEFIGVFGDASEEGSGLSFPAGLTVSDQHNVLYVSDLDNGRILRFDAFSGDFLDDPDTPDVNEGVVVDLTEELGLGEGDPIPRFTDLSYGPDGRLYVGLNPPIEVESEFGAAEVRVYNPETGVLEDSITGLDFVAALAFGPDGNLYIGDDPASLGFDPVTGLPFDPNTGPESRLLIYEIDQVHPLTDPVTGLRLESPELINAFDVGYGNAGALTVIEDVSSDEILIYLSEPSNEPELARVSVYNPMGILLDTIEPFLPDEALMANGGVDADGLPRPTGSTFILET
ncbi:MAG: CHRD domain-containing protein [Crocosphaera sp.]|nr:CHRD domain-containing protein [Crocosphaera sp.]